MKKVIFSIAAVALIATSFTSCKKGANDPFLSFKSRKGRLAGDWTVASMSYSSSWSNTTSSGGTSTTSSGTSDVTFDGSTWTEKWTNTSGGTTTDGTTTSTGTIEYTFEKDGTYTEVDNKTTVDVQHDTIFGVPYTTTTTTVENITYTGVWSFVGKNKNDEIKNKERIGMTKTGRTGTKTVTQEVSSSGQTTTSTNKETYNDTDMDATQDMWTIDQLKSKEIIAMMEMSSNDVTNTENTSGGTTTTSTTTYTSTGSGSITLDAK